VLPDETLVLDVSLGVGVNANKTFGGVALLKIWEGKKRAKIGVIYDNFRVWAQIFLEPMKIATKFKRHDAPKYVRFYNPGPKFWVSLPKKILRAENMQNLAQFR